MFLFMCFNIYTTLYSLLVLFYLIFFSVYMLELLFISCSLLRFSSITNTILFFCLIIFISRLTSCSYNLHVLYALQYRENCIYMKRVHNIMQPMRRIFLCICIELYIYLCIILYICIEIVNTTTNFCNLSNG